MKKFYLLLLTLFGIYQTPASAQDDFYGYFNHLSVGVTAGTTGVGLELATPVGPHFRLRAGTDLFRSISADVNLDLGFKDVPQNVTDILHQQGINDQEVGVDAKFNFGTTRLLFDFYPSRNGSFHLTAGAYLASDDPVTMNTTPESDNKFKTIVALGAGDKVGLELGDYFLTPDQNGHIKGAIRTNKFRPYLGLGFGRTVPKHRIAFNFDLGAQFWNTPKVYCNDQELNDQNLDSDSGEIVKTISKISVYPVISFRLCGRIF